MLLPSKLILLIQVYICLVNASSVFVNYLDGNGGGDNEIDTDEHRHHHQHQYGDSAETKVRATITSKMLPEVRANSRYSPFSYDGHPNQIIFEPGLTSIGTSQAKDQPAGYQLDDLGRPLLNGGGGSSSGEHSGNSIDSSPSSTMDFESYSVTISPTLMLNANDKDQEELEEKIEMHTNNHHSLKQNQPPTTSLSSSSNSINNQNPRHYSTYSQLPSKHHHYLLPSPPAGKYATSSSNSNNNNNINNHNLNNVNLNYIHSLLLTKPSQAANSLTSLLHSYSSSLPAPQTSPAAVQKYASQPAADNATSMLLDLTGGPQVPGSTIPMCGRQQVSAGSGSREPRIVGGNNSYEGEFPWAVSIQRHGNHHCGGVIVGRRWVLTAAHCVRSQLVGNLLVRTGGNTLARSANHLLGHLERDYVVDQIVMHSDFSRYDNLTASQMKSSANTNNADIALLRLKHEIRWNELAWPVCFPPRESGNFSGHDAVVIGWGKLNEKSEEFSNELQKVKLTIIDNKVCQNWFRQAGREMPIDDRVICAGFKNGGKDACHGDSGGPLLSKINGHYAVVGVVSTGIGCARPLLPGLYSRVSSYINWIERHIT